jgi:hypothetical protein
MELAEKTKREKERQNALARIQSDREERVKELSEQRRRHEEELKKRLE